MKTHKPKPLNLGNQHKPTPGSPTRSGEIPTQGDRRYPKDKSK